MEVYGPETHIDAVLPMALDLQPELAEADSAVSQFVSAICSKNIVVQNKTEPVAQAAPAGDRRCWCLCALSSRRLGPATVGGIKLGCIRLRNQWRCAQQHCYVKASSCRLCSMCFHVWRDVQRIEQHDQQEFQWSLRGWCHCGQRELESRYFLLITCFATTMHSASRFCCYWRGPWFGWNPWKVAKLRNPRWCVGTCARCLVVEVQFGHAGAQVGGDLESRT